MDARVRSAIKPSKGRLDLLWGPTMYHLEDLPYKEGCTDLPDVFTPFRWGRRRWDLEVEDAPVLATPAAALHA